MPDSDLSANTEKWSPEAKPLGAGAKQVLDLLLKTGGLSQAEIARQADVTQPWVARLVQSFTRDGLVQISSRQATRPGNPSVNVALNPDYVFVLGIAILGDVLSVVLLDFAGNSRGYRSTPMPDMSRGPVLKMLVHFRDELVAEAGIPMNRVIAAGIGISAYFVGEGRQINPPKYLLDWAFIEIEPLVSGILGIPVYLDNDATVAAIGESLFGVGRGSRNFAYLHLTNGFGGGIIADGKAMHGFHGNVGEFGGVWTMDGGAYPNLDLLKTCVEAHGPRFETVEDMVKMIDVSWDGVEAWLAQAVQPFSRLASLLTMIIDPELVVIGGRLPKSIAAVLADRIELTLPRMHNGRAYPAPRIVISQTSGDPVALGAAAVPLQKMFFG